MNFILSLKICFTIKNNGTANIDKKVVIYGTIIYYKYINVQIAR